MFLASLEPLSGQRGSLGVPGLSPISAPCSGPFTPESATPEPFWSTQLSPPPDTTLPLCLAVHLLSFPTRRAAAGGQDFSVLFISGT